MTRTDEVTGWGWRHSGSCGQGRPPWEDEVKAKVRRGGRSQLQDETGTLSVQNMMRTARDGLHCRVRRKKKWVEIRVLCGIFQ